MLYAIAKHAIDASSMYHIIKIKTENIAVDEISRIICSHILARTHKIIMHAWRTDV